MRSKTTKRRLRKGARLPYCERATIARGKLTDYALDPDKEPGKAKGFVAIGIWKEDWQFLHDTILYRLPFSEATHGDISDPNRIRVTVPILNVGKNSRSGTVVTCWCVDSRCTPWLTTLWAQPKRRAP